MDISKFYWLFARTMCVSFLALPSCDQPEDGYGPSRNLIFHETFEGPEPFSTVHNKETGDWEYALQFVDSVAYDGNRSARFEIKHDQPLVAEGKRSEVTIIMGSNERLKRKAWYSFAVYFPPSYAADTTYDVLSQWYYDGSPVRLLTKRDRILIDVGTDTLSKEKIDIAYLETDKWHDFVFHFIHSPLDDGYVAVWHNGEQKVSRSGGNLYSEFLPKWKIGIYKAAFESGTSLVANRVLFFDNVKIGNENATYRDMEPRRP